MIETSSEDILENTLSPCSKRRKILVLCRIVKTNLRITPRFLPKMSEGAEGGPRMSVASARIRADARTADSARTTKFRAADADLARTRLLKILKHKYLMFFYVLRMRVSPQNAVMQVTLSLQIGFFKFKKVFSE